MACEGTNLERQVGSKLVPRIQEVKALLGAKACICMSSIDSSCALFDLQYHPPVMQAFSHAGKEDMKHALTCTMLLPELAGADWPVLLKT